MVYLRISNHPTETHSQDKSIDKKKLHPKALKLSRVR